MMLVPMLMKKRGNPLAVFRGLTLATTFDEGADTEKLYATFDGTPALDGAAVATKHSTGTPTWVAGGAEFIDSSYRFSTLSYGSGVLNYLDTTTTWTLYFDGTMAAGGRIGAFSSRGGGKGSDCAIAADNAWWSNAGAHVNFASTGLTLGTTRHQYAFVCSAAGAGGIKVYVDGAEVCTLTGATATEQTTASLINIGYTHGIGYETTATLRAWVACNVAHSAAEVAAAHTALAAL